MTMKVCIDAGLGAALYVPEARSHEAHALLAEWTVRQAELVAPDLWAYEVASIVHKCVRQGRLSVSDAQETLSRILALPVRLVRPAGVHADALDLAGKLQLPAAYDAHYLAVAHMEAAAFWTLDERLYNTVHLLLPWVHRVGETIDTAN